MPDPWLRTPIPTTALPEGLVAARVARAMVREELQDWPETVAATAGLLTGELVSNAVLHGGGSVRLTMRRRDHAIRLEVSDENPSMHPRPGSPDARPAVEGGRGLLILRRLADDWGVEPGPGGKTVWFDLRLRA